MRINPSSQIAVRTPTDYYEIYGSKVTPYFHQLKNEGPATVTLFSDEADSIVRNYMAEPATEFSLKSTELAKKLFEIFTNAKKSNKFDYEIILDDIEGSMDVESYRKKLPSLKW